MLARSTRLHLVYGRLQRAAIPMLELAPIRREAQIPPVEVRVEQALIGAQDGDVEVAVTAVCLPMKRSIAQPPATHHGDLRPRSTVVASFGGLGALLGWDGPQEGLGSRVPTLGDRLPEDLRGTADGFRAPPTLPFSPLYMTHDEAAAEIANHTMHGVLHLGWVPDGSGSYRGQMAVLVKRNGRFGDAYMAAIAPFRHALVYPHMMRRIARAWPSAA